MTDTLGREPRALYFGFANKGSGGHHLRDTSLYPIHHGKHPESCPWTENYMDGGLLTDNNIQDVWDGKVYHFARDGWHAFVWWDRSGDERRNSNSGFYVSGVDETDIAFEFAEEEYPEIIERQKFDLRIEP